tara:strand:+ start:646 stop:1017 length:372 start_codon:yes stop_codon:yes gene_type:complete
MKSQKSIFCVKKLMNLIIQAVLSEPPTETLPFRDFTWKAKKKYSSILVEVDSHAKDLYWRYMKPKGMLDFVDDIIVYEDMERGLRIVPKEVSNPFFVSPLIKINKINLNNYSKICSLILRGEL